MEHPPVRKERQKRRPGACTRARSRAERPSEHSGDPLDTGQRRVCVRRASVAGTHRVFRRPVQHVSPFGRGRVGTLGRVLCVTMKPLGALRPGQAVDPPGGVARVSSGPGETN